MDLDNLFDAISSMVMAFYAFGYMDVFYWGTLWVITSSIGQLLSSYYDYLNNDAYRTTKYGFHSLFWQIQAWEKFMLTVIIRSENVEETREGMIGDLFCCIIACILASLSMNLLERIQNVFFALLTITTIQYLSDEEDRFFFGIICLLYALISLYATCINPVNSNKKEDLMPTGPQITSKVHVIFTSFQNLIIQFIQNNGFPETTSSHIFNALLYVCNGLAALSAIQGALIYSARHSIRIPSVMTPGAVFQLYVCSIQAHKGRRLSSLLPFCYAVTWATWTWLQFSASLNDTGNTKRITLGTLIFLIINIFFIILDADVNIILVLLTLFMEVLSVSFFLIIWEPLPLPLEVTMLAILGAVSIYGTVASFTIFMFKTDFISLGLLRTEKPPKAHFSLSVISVSSKPGFSESVELETIYHTRNIQTLLKLFKDNGLCLIPIDTLNTLIASSKKASTLDYHRLQNKKLPSKYLLSKSQSELKPLSLNQSKSSSHHSFKKARNVQDIVKIFENDSRSRLPSDTESESESDSDKEKQEEK